MSVFTTPAPVAWRRAVVPRIFTAFFSAKGRGSGFRQQRQHLHPPDPTAYAVDLPMASEPGTNVIRPCTTRSHGTPPAPLLSFQCGAGAHAAQLAAALGFTPVQRSRGPACTVELVGLVAAGAECCAASRDCTRTRDGRQARLCVPPPTVVRAVKKATAAA